MHFPHLPLNAVPLVAGIDEALGGFRPFGLTHQTGDFAGQRLTLGRGPGADHRTARGDGAQSIDHDIDGLVVLRRDQHRLAPAYGGRHRVQHHLRLA